MSRHVSASERPYEDAGGNRGPFITRMTKDAGWDDDDGDGDETISRRGQFEKYCDCAAGNIAPGAYEEPWE